MASAVPPQQLPTSLPGVAPKPTPAFPVLGVNGAVAGAMSEPAPPVTPVAPAVPGLYPNSSLYVGDLHPSVTETDLVDLFSQVAPVVSVRVCRDHNMNRSLGYGYVNLNNFQDAMKAIASLNFLPLNGKPIRIMFSHRDPSMRISGYANLFIKNLESDINNKALHEIFAAFGNILSCKVATDFNGRSKGYGFVQFDKEESAQNAIQSMNGMLINGREVFVGLFVRRQDRERVAKGSPTFTNVYVKNLAEIIDENELTEIFQPYGDITSVAIMKDNGRSRGFGFVNFKLHESAVTAIEKLNGTTHHDKVWYVGRAMTKSEREAELRGKFEQERNGRFEKLYGANLYLKNLDDNVNEDRLREMFSEFGNITSVKIMVDAQGQSKGSGFVAFATPEEASKAMIEMKGKMIGRKPLYVAVAQRKEERRARLAQFSQLRAPGLAHVQYAINGFHHGGPRFIHQQLYYGQGSPGAFSHQPMGYGYHQQLYPGIRPGVGDTHQQQVLPYGLRSGAAPHRQQMRNGNHGFGYMSNGRNGYNPSFVFQNLVNPNHPLPLNVSAVSVSSSDAPRPGPVNNEMLTSALTSVPPEQQRLMLGERLYPQVEKIERESAGKITGMLLEMDQPEVLHLIEDSTALKIKVKEAKEVLHTHSEVPGDAAAE